MSVEKIFKNQLEIECVLGLTCSSPFSLLTLGENHLIYPAGATAVKYDSIQDIQISHIIAENAPKSISCLSKSIDDSLIVIGESGHQPRILVYDVKEEKMIAKLTCHKYGVLTAQFSPDMTFLVSVGCHHDGFIYLWDWKTRQRLYGVKIAAPLFSLAFDPQSKYFVTCGEKHMKLWDLKDIKEKLISGVSNESLNNNFLEGRSARLGEHKDTTLVDICCIQTKETNETFTYAMTLDGYLLMFNSKGILEKWLHAKMEKGSCIRATSNYLICGGSEGKVRLFEPITLKHLGNISAPEPLIDQESDSSDSEYQKTYPQIVCIQPTHDSQIAIVYSNMTLVIFDAENLKNITQKRTIKNHSDCIWGVQPFSMNSSRISEEKDGFITYSSDGSVRFWDSSALNNASISKHNNPSHIASLLADPNGAKKFQFFDRFGLSNDIKSVTERTGIRSFAIDPEKKIIACGDRNGSIGIFLFENFKKIANIEAHDAEIMVLNFALLGDDKMLVLSSASRDRLIHIFDANQREGVYPFDLLQTLDDHSSTLTSIMFVDSGSKLISCGADKAIIFRSLQDDSQLNFAMYRNTPLRSTVYDMALAQVSRTIITASQDKRITCLDIDSGKPTRSFVVSLQSLDNSIKASPFLSTLTTDPTGSIICAGASDKTIHLIECQTGDSLYQGYGHGDLVTNVAFINQGSHIVSTSADGCAFIWKVPETIIKKMGYLPKLTDLSLPLAPMENDEISPGPVFQFDESHLPLWARTEKKEILENDSIPQAAQGRWAERIGKDGIKLFSQDQDSAIPAVAKSGIDPNGSFPLENEQMKSAESMKEASTSVANISIHVVDSSEIFCTDNDKISSERLIQDPFADTIETDSDEVLSEVLDMNSDDNSNLQNRNSKSSQHFRKAHFAPKNTIQPVGKNLPDLEEKNKDEQDVTNITPKNTNNPIGKNLPDLEEKNKDEQDVTKIHIQKLDGESYSNVTSLAERVANPIISLKKFQPIIESLDNEKIYNILDRYSDILVEMVKEKLKNV